MQRFLFRFGYSTPAQWKSNQTHGWDDECSGAFFVYADRSEDALWWGCEVAERFVQYQFEQAGWNEIPGWKESQFAFWIDENPALTFPIESLTQAPEVAFNNVPDFRNWK
jgi:hypothetical protein